MKNQSCVPRSQTGSSRSAQWRSFPHCKFNPYHYSCTLIFFFFFLFYRLFSFFSRRSLDWTNYFIGFKNNKRQIRLTLFSYSTRWIHRKGPKYSIIFQLKNYAEVKLDFIRSVFSFVSIDDTVAIKYWKYQRERCDNISKIENWLKQTNKSSQRRFRRCHRRAGASRRWSKRM